MMKLAIGAALGALLFAATPVSAAPPVPTTLEVTSSTVEKVHYRRYKHRHYRSHRYSGYRGYKRHRHGYYGHRRHSPGFSLHIGSGRRSYR